MASRRKEKKKVGHNVLNNMIPMAIISHKTTSYCANNTIHMAIISHKTNVYCTKYYGDDEDGHPWIDG